MNETTPLRAVRTVPPLHELKRQIQGYETSIAVSVAGLDSSLLTGKHVNCPFSRHGGKNDFRFDNKFGKGNWICTCQQNGGDIFDLVMINRNCDFIEAMKLINDFLNGANNLAPIRTTQPVRLKAMSTDEQRDKMRKLWRESLPITLASAAGKYLTKTRMLPLEQFPGALRSHPAVCTANSDSLHCGPALLAIYSDPTGKNVQIHRTFLTVNGQKADIEKPKKMMPGPVADGGAIRLSNPADHLGIAEGIETALSVTALYGLPCWAAYSGDALAKFVPPNEVTEITIFADNDGKGKGSASAIKLYERLTAKGLKVSILMPSVAGEDFNDILKQTVEAQSA